MARNLRRTFDIAGNAAERVVRFREEHHLGRPPALEIEVRYTEYVPLESMMGQVARLECGFGDEPSHVFLGIVEEAGVIGSSLTELNAHQYLLKIVPKLALLARYVDSRIFQKMTVKEIVEKVLTDLGVTAQQWRLTSSYPKRDYTVQYQESALDFVNRLLEDEGIYYFLEAGDDGEIVVFSDDSSSAAPMAGAPDLPVRGGTQLGTDQDYSRIPSDQRRVRSGKFTLRDYNFEKPSLDLTATAVAADDTDLEIYDYPGNYEDPADGARLAKIKLEAEQAWAHTVEIEAVCPRLAAGRLLELVDAADLDGEYFVAEAVHTFQDVSGETTGVDYGVRARLVPKAVPYRRPQDTPRPVIHGPQTATVVVPPGSQMESIHTDKHGRCKVLFNWDRYGKRDDTASCWMRVAQLQTSGSLVLPRVEWEVIVEFLEGNPDRPVITGRLYNGAFMPPYALPEGKTRTSWQTRSTPGGGGSNEIRFEDKAGSEEIMIDVEKDMTIDTANNKTKHVGHNETIVIGANSNLSVGADQSVAITKGSQNTIVGDQTVSVGGNRSVEVNAVTGLTIGGSATTSVGGNQMEMIGNAIEGLLAVAAERTEEFLAAKADAAVAAVQAQVQGAVGQALGPINNLTSRVQAMGNNMQAVANGDLGAVGGMVGDASRIPGAGDFARSMGGGSGGGPAGGPLAGAVAGGNMITSAANNAVTGGAGAARSLAGQAIGGGVGAARSALAGALGVDADGGGGQSTANAGGPAGDVGGQDETDRAKGPGHSVAVITGTHSETVGSMKVVGVLDGIHTNVGGSMTRDAGAAHVQVVLGSRAESVEGDKTEKAIGLVVLSKAGESEQVSGSKTAMIGGAVIDKLKGSQAIVAGGPATFIGAFHKLEAKTKITLVCGGSELVIDGGGVAITSPIVTVMAAKISLTKAVSEA